jgi:hypothetical protein
MMKWSLKKKLITLLIFIISIFYFKAFFTKGVFFEDTFLKKHVIGNECHYKGEHIEGNIDIAVKGKVEEGNSVDVIYKLPNNINKKYEVVFNKVDKLDESYEFEIYEESKRVYKGSYNNALPFLLNEYNEPLVCISVGFHNTNQFNQDYKIYFTNVLAFAMRTNERIRGEFKLLLISFIMFLGTLIDYKFPLFSFKLKYILSVDDPEPSDFYLFMQRLSWYVVPIIGVIIMIIALFFEKFEDMFV